MNDLTKNRTEHIIELIKKIVELSRDPDNSIDYVFCYRHDGETGILTSESDGMVLIGLLSSFSMEVQKSVFAKEPTDLVPEEKKEELQKIEPDKKDEDLIN